MHRNKRSSPRSVRRDIEAKEASLAALLQVAGETPTATQQYRIRQLRIELDCLRSDLDARIARARVAKRAY